MLRIANPAIETRFGKFGIDAFEIEKIDVRPYGAKSTQGYAVIARAPKYGGNFFTAATNPIEPKIIEVFDTQEAAEKYLHDLIEEATYVK